ncbi:MAG: DUF2589 domain-containing protein [Acetatifactor sp.]|nr:DUF2589 domain-containing protein [Acetatifactor sp.]
MPYGMDKREDNLSGEEVKGEGVVDNDFILLDDLVFAPLHALAKSNQQLREHIVEAIRSMGTSKQNGQEEIIHLNNINIAYDQVRAEAEEGYSVDNLQLQVPLLSIVPMTNLNVEKAEIDFSTEVKAVTNQETGEAKINARICSPSQRDSDFLPKVSYKLKVSSIPATEGIMRLTDSLSTNQVTKKLDTTPVVDNGDLGNEEQKALIQETKRLRVKIGKLKQLHQRIADMIAEQERLHQISMDAFEEDTYDFDKERYLMAQSNIINRIMEYQEQIINKEILYGLENDYK